MEKQEENNHVPRVRGLTTLAMIFLSIAGLLIVAFVLPSKITMATTSNLSSSNNNTVLPRTSQSSLSSLPPLNTSNKVLIAGDESDKPYMPGLITIKIGDKVGWINTDEEVHTVTSGFENSTDKGKQFDSGLLNTNQTFEHTFDKAGTYNYFCTVHPTMTGVVNVK
jgi:plastocyanin